MNLFLKTEYIFNMLNMSIKFIQKSKSSLGLITIYYTFLKKDDNYVLSIVFKAKKEGKVFFGIFLIIKDISKCVFV